MTSPGRPRGTARWAQAIAAAAGTALALAAAGCGAQAEPGYLGEPLVILSGQVVDGPATASQPVEAAILWQRSTALSAAGQLLGARAPVEGGAFTVRLYQPPPAEARLALAPGEPAVARATAAVVPLGLTGPQATQVGDATSPAQVPGSYGIDPAHWLVWLEADAPAGSLTAWWLGGALPAGYHVVRVEPFAPACQPAAALDACAAEVLAAGAADAGAAQALCLTPYRLSLAPAADVLRLQPGTLGVAAPAGCP